MNTPNNQPQNTPQQCKQCDFKCYDYAYMIQHVKAAHPSHPNHTEPKQVEGDETVKAYGGCKLCYGKGYATVNDQWVAHDTDTDIGSPGGYYKGGRPFAMKYCTCGRGKQLETLVGQQIQAAQEKHRTEKIQKTQSLCSCPMCEHHTKAYELHVLPDEQLQKEEK
jgi:hypothetical protein